MLSLTTGTRWPSSSSRARLFTYMQIRRRWEREVLERLALKCGLSSQFVILSCTTSYFPTRRTKRLSWHTLHPHRRLANTFGSVEWRIKRFTSKSAHLISLGLSLSSAVRLLLFSYKTRHELLQTFSGWAFLCRRNVSASIIYHRNDPASTKVKEVKFLGVIINEGITLHL